MPVKMDLRRVVKRVEKHRDDRQGLWDRVKDKHFDPVPKIPFVPLKAKRLHRQKSTMQFLSSIAEKVHLSDEDFEAIEKVLSLVESLEVSDFEVD